MLIKKCAHWVADTVAVVFLLVVLLAGLALWRLSSGPLSLDFAAAYVQEQIARHAGAYTIRTGEMSVSLTLLDNTGGLILPKLQFKAADVTVHPHSETQTEPLLSEADITLLISPERIVSAVLDNTAPIPQTVIITGPRIIVYREAEDTTAPSPQTALTEQVAIAMRHLSRNRARFPDRVTIANGTVAFRDPVAGRVLRIGPITATAFRNGRAMNVSGSVGLTVDETDVPLRLNLSLPWRGEPSLVVSADRFQTTTLAALTGWNLPLDITANLRADVIVGADYTPQSLRLTARAPGDGTLKLPTLYNTPMTVRDVQVQMSSPLNAMPPDIMLDDARLLLAAPGSDVTVPLSATGSVMFHDNRPILQLEAGLTDMDMAELAPFWPQKLAPITRRWVTTHIPVGDVSKATLNLGMRLGEDGAAIMDTVDGAIHFTDATVNYLSTMPDVTDVDGIATFNKKEFRITAAHAHSLDTKTTAAEVVIAPLGVLVPRLTLDATLTGPIKDGLTVVDSEPLRFARALGLSPDGIDGQAETQLRLDFPIKPTLTFREITATTTATLTDVAIAEGIGPYALTEGALALALDNTGMTVEGTALLNGVPAAVTWTEGFTAETRKTGATTFKATLSPAHREALGLSFLSPFLDGPVTVDGTLKQGEETRTLIVDADLEQTTLHLPYTGYTKPVGTAALGRVVMKLPPEDSGQSMTLDTLTLQGDGLIAEAAGQFSGQTIKRLDINGLRIGRTDVRGVLHWDGPHLSDVSLKGQSLDLDATIRGVVKEITAAKGRPPRPDAPPLILTLDLERVIGRFGQDVKQVKGQLTLQQGRITVADVMATAQSGDQTLTLKSGGDGSLNVETASAGQFLEGLGILRGLRGGVLDLKAHYGDTGTALQGRISAADFTLRDAPLLARLLNAISAGGFLELLSGQGLQFMRLETGFGFDDGVMSFNKGRMAGASIGLTFDGRMNLNDSTIAMQGSIVPVYIVNQVLGAIPLLGQLITGGVGQGVFAATYDMRGALDTPQVSVNPLAALAPGFLRNIFFLPAEGP